MEWRLENGKQEIMRLGPGTSVKAGVQVFYNGRLAFDFGVDISTSLPGVMWVDPEEQEKATAKEQEELGTLRYENTFLRQRIDGLLDTIVELQRSGSAGSVSAPSGSSSELS